MAHLNEAGQDELIDRLAGFRDRRSRTSYLRRHQQLWTPAVVDQLYAHVLRVARIDLQRADGLAQAAQWIADKLDDERCRAQSLRALGHLRALGGKHEEALEYFEEALRLYLQLGHDIDVARTLNGAIQSFNPLGRYEEALASAEQARGIFERHDKELSLARLDINVGNIFFRQDRFDEALALYRTAYERVAQTGEPQDVAAALGNMAMTYTCLNDFRRAQETYEKARAYSERHNLPLLVMQIDYNVAYLYYLRGEYTRALEAYRVARHQSEQLDDTYHCALCDLDRSEMYLELNLNEEASELAERALALFDGLGIGYEAAKALTNLALATGREGDTRRALELFDQARERFTREGNQVWLALVNYYQALVLYRQGLYARARALCEAALALFARAAVPGKTALCELLLARVELQEGDLDAAERACGAALAKLAGTEAPILSYHAHFVLGLVRESRGDRQAAYDAFRKAHDGLEHLRSHLQVEDAKVAFFEDKMVVYESLVTTCLTLASDREHQEAAFGYIENAKSRGLADLIAFRATALAPRVTGAASDKVRRLRERLNWHYRQLELEEMADTKNAVRRVDRLRRTTHTLERQLIGSLEEVGRTDQEFSALQTGRASGLDEIRSTLPSDTILLEYYQARGQYYVCILTRDALDVLPLVSAAEVRGILRLLKFQLSKFRLGPHYLEAIGDRLRTATETHLRELYEVLIAPLRDRLQASHLIVVPHDILHGVPFHALFDGERFLIDDFTVSHAPSSSVYRLCRAKAVTKGSGALLMGVPDIRAPFIADEIAGVARVLPESRVFLGSEATADQLRTHSAESRFVHIAAHGLFRRDNPMFSSIRLGDGPLGVYDLYQLRLSAELVTLSGCSTGRSAVVGGDELLGLVRGLLYAGARAVLLTLWDAYDRSAADFMTAFYGHLQSGHSKGVAAQQAMRELRRAYPHPFYWAPFTLIGDIQES